MNAWNSTWKLVTVVGLATQAVACGGSSGFGGMSKSAEAPSAEPAGAAAFDGGGAGFDGSAPIAQTAPPPPPSEAADGDAFREEESSERPGLGTTWGETRLSKISSAPFERADKDSPFTSASLFYNDESGARAMAQRHGGDGRRVEALVPVAGGALAMGLTDGSGRFLTAFAAGSKRFVVGDEGDRYNIVVRNRTDQRFEIVLSVDGLDVLDGRDASFAKRGYLLDPHGELEIDGFRQSLDTVAAFRFGGIESSYAEKKHGNSRNVGVIGLAAFHERGSNPFPWTQRELDRRDDANPFPGTFATPPN